MIYVLLFLSVFIGYFLALFFHRRGITQSAILLAFSGAFLLSVTLFELLPEVFENPSKELGLLIMSGILLQIVLDFFSKGAEHGHVHLPAETFQFPWMLFISLSIHSLIEGVPAASNDSMLVGIMVHKVPIALILTLFFIRARLGTARILIFLLLFAAMTPLGSFISSELEVINTYKTQINALAIGVLLHVSTTILFESSRDHKFNLAKLTAIVIGIVVAYFV